MALPDSWNYWIEITAGDRSWIDLDGNPMNSIVFSVLQPDPSVNIFDGVAIFPLDLNPAPIVSEIESFPLNLLQRIPDFQFSTSCGYTKPDGSFTTQDLLESLAEINRATGRSFDLLGCRYAVVVGECSRVGYWCKDGLWRGAFDTYPLETPIADESMRVEHGGIISKIEYDNVDTITFQTTWPDEFAKVGRIVDGSDTSGAIYPLVFAQSESNQAEVILRDGLLEFDSTLVDPILYYKPSENGNLFVVDPSSYTISGSPTLMNLRKGVTGYAVTVAGELGSYDSVLTNYINNSDGGKLERLNLVFDATPDQSEIAFCSPSTVLNIGPFDSEDVEGEEQFTNRISGRALDGTTRSTTMLSSAQLFTSSLMPDGKYKVRIKTTSKPYRVYDGQNTIALQNGAFLAKRSAGDLAKFLANCETGVNYGFGAFNDRGNEQVVIQRGMAYNPQTNTYPDYQSARINLSFSDIVGLSGEVDKARIYLTCKYLAWGSTGFKTVTINSKNEVLLKLLFATQSGGAFTFESDYSAPIELEVAGKGITAQDLAELTIDVYYTEVNETATSHNCGYFAIWGAKIEVESVEDVKDGSKFILESKSSVGGGIQGSASFLYSAFCPQQFFTSVSGSFYEANACITSQESLRDVMRDLLFATSMILERDILSDTKELVIFKATNETILDSYETVIDQASVIATDLPEINVFNASLNDIYSAIQLDFGFNLGTGKYTKMLYIDKNGVKTVGYNAGDLSDVVSRCAFADNYLRGTNRVFRFTSRFSSEFQTEAIVRLVSRYLCYPCKTATADVVYLDALTCDLGTTVQFTGDLLQAVVKSRKWLVVGKAVNIPECETQLKFLEVPEWPS